MGKLRNWLKQPTSVAGLATLLGTLSALLMRQVSWMQATPLLAGAVCSIVLPDNSRVKSAAEALATELVTENAGKE